MTTDPGGSAPAPNGHRHCLLCGDRNPWSLGLSFHGQADGAVTARFPARGRLQGYDDILHGGVVAALLDAAMTHCLFHQGVRAVTGDLRVRYVQPVPCPADLDLHARVVSADPRLYRLRAELRVGGDLHAWAEARFRRRGGAS